jgi:predicted tellurium resistance membrane protein TerC
VSLGRLIDRFKKTKYAALLLLIFLGGSLPRIARADAGVLIPKDKEAPDPASPFTG